MSGLAKTNFEIIDLSLLINTGLKGICGVIGATDLGLHGKRQLVGTWPEFQKFYGNLRSDTLFPLLCKRALEAGGRLKITRAGHYTNTSNPSTLVGTKATTVVANTLTRAVDAITTGSSGTFVFNGVDLTVPLAVGKTFAITGANSGNATYTVTAVVYAGGNTTVTVATVPGGMLVTGAEATYDITHFLYTAKAVGTGYNNFTITHSTNLADSTKVDVTVQHSALPDVMETATIAKEPTAGQIATLNAALRYVDLTSTPLTNVVVVGGALTGGLETIANIVNADYEGASGTNPTGIYVFDEDTEITRICIPEKSDTALDAVLAAYVDNRKDILGVHKTPLAVDGYIAVDYRECTGAYSGTPIDSWRNIMFFGGITVKNPLDSLETDISVVGDMLGIMSTKDNKQAEWFAFSGFKRGKLKNVIKVVYNLGTPARVAEADYVDAHGLNPIINHSSFGPISWGNGTLQKADTMLKHANIAELLLFIQRSVKPLCESELFDPNDPITWQGIYRNVKRFMDYIKEKRAMYDWKYEGDQDVDNIADITTNNANDVAAGKYVFRLYVKPTPAMKYIGVKVVVTNADANLSVFEDTEI